MLFRFTNYIFCFRLGYIPYFKKIIDFVCKFITYLTINYKTQAMDNLVGGIVSHFITSLPSSLINILIRAEVSKNRTFVGIFIGLSAHSRNSCTRYNMCLLFLYHLDLYFLQLFYSQSFCRDLSCFLVYQLMEIKTASFLI